MVAAMATSEKITSIKNPRIKFIHDLLNDKDSRTENRLFVTEGIRLAEEVLHSGIMPEIVLFSDQLPERGKQIVRSFASTAASLISVPDNVMNKVSDTQTSQGLLMVIPQQITPLPKSVNLVLILDQVRDPGNAGAILRTAAAAAVQVVFFPQGSVDPYMPKVVRSGMGAHFHLCISQMNWEEISAYCRKTNNPPVEILAAESGGGQNIWQYDFRKPIALVIGSEAEGISSDARRFIDKSIHIPMPGGFESLNAAVAASIILFEIVHQRSS